MWGDIQRPVMKRQLFVQRGVPRRGRDDLIT
jgi:hypothetical protein